MITGSAPTLDSTRFESTTAFDTASDNTLREVSWQRELAESVRNPEELLKLLQLPTDFLDGAARAGSDFPLRVPRPYLNRISKGDPDDPLLKQILPLGDELIAAPGYQQDPLQESAANPAPGLIHKYHGRALLIVNPNCAINCRYCFRRHFPYQQNNPGRNEWQQALDYIAADTSISEIIYSGGDPLATSDKQLLWLTEQIASISHVKRLRIHTRLPIVIPSRITRDCMDWLTNTRLQPVVVVHCNHPQELDSDVGRALAKLKSAGIQLLNQSVLLAGVNDNPDTLRQLSEKLFDYGTLPYYLHLLDKVAGAAHFDVPEHRARQIRDQLHASLPGYLVPKLVREIAGEPGKSPLL